MVGLFRVARRKVCPNPKPFESFEARWKGPVRFFAVGLCVLAVVITAMEVVPWM